MSTQTTKPLMAWEPTMPLFPSGSELVLVAVAVAAIVFWVLKGKKR